MVYNTIHLIFSQNLNSKSVLFIVLLYDITITIPAVKPVTMAHSWVKLCCCVWHDDWGLIRLCVSVPVDTAAVLLLLHRCCRLHTPLTEALTATATAATNEHTHTYTHIHIHTRQQEECHRDRCCRHRGYIRRWF